MKHTSKIHDTLFLPYEPCYCELVSPLRPMPICISTQQAVLLFSCNFQQVIASFAVEIDVRIVWSGAEDLPVLTDLSLSFTASPGIRTAGL